jgi:hypothetical protein
MRRVLVASPTYSGEVYAAFSFSLGQMLRLNHEGGYGFDIRDYYPRGKVIHVARNDCLAQAMQYGFDDLVWIDADQDWKPEWFFQLLSYPVDVVGAPVRKKTDEVELYNVRCASPEGLGLDPTTGLWTSADMAVGCGFLRMSRKAVEAVWNASQPYTDSDEEERRWVFDFCPVGGRLVGEDTALCDRLRKLDFPIWIAPHINPGHHDGMKRYEGNFIDFVQRWKAERRQVAA